MTIPFPGASKLPIAHAQLVRALVTGMWLEDDGSVVVRMKGGCDIGLIEAVVRVAPGNDLSVGVGDPFNLWLGVDGGPSEELPDGG